MNRLSFLRTIGLASLAAPLIGKSLPQSDLPIRDPFSVFDPFPADWQFGPLITETYIDAPTIKRYGSTMDYPTDVVLVHEYTNGRYINVNPHHLQDTHEGIFCSMGRFGGREVGQSYPNRFFAFNITITRPSIYDTNPVTTVTYRRILRPLLSAHDHSS